MTMNAFVKSSMSLQQQTLPEEMKKERTKNTNRISATTLRIRAYMTATLFPRMMSELR